MAAFGSGSTSSSDDDDDDDDDTQGILATAQKLVEYRDALRRKSQEASRLADRCESLERERDALSYAVDKLELANERATSTSQKEESRSRAFALRVGDALGDIELQHARARAQALEIARLAAYVEHAGDDRTSSRARQIVDAAHALAETMERSPRVVGVGESVVRESAARSREPPLPREPTAPRPMSAEPRSRPLLAASPRAARGGARRPTSRRGARKALGDGHEPVNMPRRTAAAPARSGELAQLQRIIASQQQELAACTRALAAVTDTGNTRAHESSPSSHAAPRLRASLSSVVAAHGVSTVTVANPRIGHSRGGRRRPSQESQWADDSIREAVPPAARRSRTPTSGTAGRVPGAPGAQHWSHEEKLVLARLESLRRLR